jgi:UDP-N-acetylglucosamine 2-epimerase (non-hydrolysing)
MRITFILGTRPEIIKTSPVIKECDSRGIDYFIIHTGQHFSYEMDKIFFEQLELKSPKYNIKTSKILSEGVVGKDSRKEIFENPDGCIHHGKQMGLMLGKIEEILFNERPDFVLVHGDTNTTLAGALAAIKLHIDIGHIEAGLRSFDTSMPEEINRILVDRISNYLFCPTDIQKNLLLSEGIEKRKISITGNTIVDLIYNHKEKIKQTARKVLDKENLKSKEFFLLTIHREENVDSLKNLKTIIMTMNEIGKIYEVPIIFPLHPRTELKIQKEIGMDNLSLQMIKPLGFFEFISLEKEARLIFSDSGGVQEEACVLNTPCITLRSTTERPETIEVNANILSGLSKTEVFNRVKYMLNRKTDWRNPLGDGTTSQKILDILVESSQLKKHNIF